MTSIVQNDYTREVIHENLAQFSDYFYLGGVLEQEEIGVKIGHDSKVVIEQKSNGTFIETYPLPVTRDRTHFVAKLRGREDFIRAILKDAVEEFSRRHDLQSVSINPKYLITSVRPLRTEDNTGLFLGTLAIPVKNVFDNPFAKTNLMGLSAALTKGLLFIKGYDPNYIVDQLNKLIGLTGYLNKGFAPYRDNIRVVYPMERMPEATFGELRETLLKEFEGTGVEISQGTSPQHKKTQKINIGVPRFSLTLPPLHYQYVCEKLQNSITGIADTTRWRIKRLAEPYAPTPRG